MTEFALFDSHFHIWATSDVPHAWLAFGASHPLPALGDLAAIQRRYGLANHLNCAAPSRIVGGIVVEGGADCKEAELDWIAAEIAGKGGFGVVAPVEMLAKEAEALISTRAARAEVVGFRQILNWDPSNPTWCFAPDDLMAHPEFEARLRQIAGLGKTFDAQLWHGQFHALAALCRAIPTLRVVIDHCGMPLGLPGPELGAWSRELGVFSDLPQVSMKLSGLGMFQANWTAAHYAPVLDAIAEVFGLDRIMFGSNFPVDLPLMPFGDAIAELQSWARTRQDGFERKLFLTNGMRFYGLKGASAPLSTRHP
jgi:predicted TIM-barrel fold metal-dependent hydrolase